MAGQRRDRVFEELGLLEPQVQINPIETFGIDPAFAQQLLAADKSGDQLRVAVTGMQRTLVKMYHPDNAETGDRERFEALSQATEIFDAADAATMKRWTTTPRTSDTSHARAQQLQQVRQTTERAADTLRTGFDYTNHPNHFTKLNERQGLLAERVGGLILLRAVKDGLQVAQGVRVGASELQRKLPSGTVFNLVDFLQKNGSFGLKPGDPVRAFVSENGQATLLDEDLRFMMDVSDPVRTYLEKRARYSADTISTIGESDAWMRQKNPVLYQTHVPGREYMGGKRTPTTIAFELRRGAGRTNVAWDLDYSAIGSIADAEFMRRVRGQKDVRSIGSDEPSDAAGRRSFNLLAFPIERMVDTDIGWSPLLVRGSNLLLYSHELGMPIATDARIVGLIGEGAELE